VSLDVVIVGHVDHGKSTLIGRLLYDSEALPEDKMAEVQKLIEEYKRQFEFAYFLDSFQEELEEERTIDTTRVLFKGRDYYTIVDVPGHKEFIKNMLTGASHAEVAVLVVSAPDGIQEQTRRHAFLLHMLGIKKVLVAVNKMDLVDYAKDAFESVRGEVSRLLGDMGFSGLKYLPVSALEGDNVYKPSERMPWYQGSTVIQLLDEIELPSIIEQAPVFVVQDVYNLDAERVIVGRVESGILRVGDRLTFQPAGVSGTVEKIKVYPCDVSEAGAGDSVGIVAGCDVERGNVGGRPENPPEAVSSFLGELVLLEGTLSRGEQVEMKCGTMKTSCLIHDIKEKMSSETGEVLQTNPAAIGENEAATVIFRTEPMVVSRFAEMPELGRFILVRDGKNIGAGIVLDTAV